MHQPFPDDSFLARWLSGELSEAELQTLQEREDYEQLQKIVLGAAHLETPTYSEKDAWERLQKAKMQQKSEPARTYAVRRWLGTAAAIALLLFGVWYWSQMPGEQVFITNGGERLAIALPDGSNVLLQEHSQLSYTNNWTSKRSVALQGEAYFDIEKGKPFSVVLTEGQVNVLGTSFKITSIKNSLDVDCYEGRVEVAYQSSREILNPGDQAQSAKNGTLQVNRGKQQKATVQEVLRFQKSPLKEVFQAMALHFKVKIQVPKTEERTYTGFFQTDNLTQALKTVCDPMSLTYSFKGKDTIIISKK